MMKKLFMIIATAALGACYPAPGKPAYTPIDGPVAAGTEADCQAACAALRAHHCPDGDPTPRGGTCEAVCLNTERSGYASMHPACVAKIDSCAGEDACANP